MVTPALVTIGSLVSGTDTQTQQVVDAGVLPALLPLLRHPKKRIRKDVCWALSNIAAGTPVQVATLLEHENPAAAKELLHVAAEDDWEVRKEAAIALLNACNGCSRQHLQKLLQLGVVQTLTSLLNAPDVNISAVALDAMEAVAERSGDEDKCHKIFVAADVPAQVQRLAKTTTDQVRPPDPAAKPYRCALMPNATRLLASRIPWDRRGRAQKSVQTPLWSRRAPRTHRPRRPSPQAVFRKAAALLKCYFPNAERQLWLSVGKCRLNTALAAAANETAGSADAAEPSEAGSEAGGGDVASKPAGSGDSPTHGEGVVVDADTSALHSDAGGQRTSADSATAAVVHVYDAASVAAIAAAAAAVACAIATVSGAVAAKAVAMALQKVKGVPEQLQQTGGGPGYVDPDATEEDSDTEDGSAADDATLDTFDGSGSPPAQ